MQSWEENILDNACMWSIKQNPSFEQCLIVENLKDTFILALHSALSVIKPRVGTEKYVVFSPKPSFLFFDILYFIIQKMKPFFG